MARNPIKWAPRLGANTTSHGGPRPYLKVNLRSRRAGRDVDAMLGEFIGRTASECFNLGTK